MSGALHLHDAEPWDRSCRTVDPFTERRVDGLDAMQVRLAPMKTMKPPFTDPRCDMIDPKVQRHGDVALLTFNLVNYGKLAGAPERVLPICHCSQEPMPNDSIRARSGC